MERYDLVVIGSGPAGEKGATQAAYFGKKVAVVERAPVPGGASANWGTLPSKTLRESALYLSGIRARGLERVAHTVAPTELTVADLMHRKDLVVAREHERIRWNLGRHGITLVQGEASFADPHLVRVRGPGGERELQADVFLIATGSRPARPPGIAFEAIEILDSDEVLTLDKIPRSLCVVGAGVVGCEYACTFAALGVEVTLCDGRDRLLGFLDREVSDLLLAEMRKMMTVILGAPVETVVAKDGASVTTLKTGPAIHAERVLVAAGRNGATEALDLAAAGLSADKRGLLSVNDRFQTEVPHIYAAGDVVGNPALASVSMEQARVAMCYAFGLAYKRRVHPLLPYGIYTLPEVSALGETEESAREQGIPYEVGRAGYAYNARGTIAGDTTGLVKIVFRRDDHRLIGAHVVGERACEIIHVALAYMQMDATFDVFIDAVFNYPSLSEAYKYAAYDGLGRVARGRVLDIEKKSD